MPTTTKKKPLLKADIELIKRGLNRLVYDEEMQLVRFANEHFVESDGKGGWKYFNGKTFADLKKFIETNPEPGKMHSFSVLEKLREEVAALEKKLDG
jgi:hypothetical protein